jgi:hypothetical protein
MSAFGGKACLHLHVWRNRRIVLVPGKRALHGTRHQYFSNGFSRSNYGDGHSRLGHVQEGFVTPIRRECLLMTHSGHWSRAANLL